MKEATASDRQAGNALLGVRKRVIWGLTARITKDFTDYCKEIL